VNVKLFFENDAKRSRAGAGCQPLYSSSSRPPSRTRQLIIALSLMIKREGRDRSETLCLLRSVNGQKSGLGSGGSRRLLVRFSLRVHRGLEASLVPTFMEKHESGQTTILKHTATSARRESRERFLAFALDGYLRMLHRRHGASLLLSPNETLV
jgi:hypothetical protein